MGRHHRRRLPRVGARAAAVRRRLRRPVRLRRLDPTKIIPEEEVPEPPGSAAWSWSEVAGQDFLRRDRAGGVLHAERGSPASTSPTTRCCRAGNTPCSTPSSKQLGQSQLLTHLHHERARVPPIHNSRAGRAHGHGGNPQEARVDLPRGQTPGIRPGPREEPSGRLPHLPRRAARPGRAQAEVAPGELRRPPPQRRQFFVSQAEVERRHIIDAVRLRAEQVRLRSGSGPGSWPDCATSTDEAGRSAVADGLGLAGLPGGGRSRPPGSRAADLRASPALSILANGPDSFAGRKRLGILVTTGTDAGKLAELRAAAEQERSPSNWSPRWSGRRRDQRRRPGTRRPGSYDGGPSVCATTRSHRASPPRAARRRWPPCRPRGIS